LAALGTTLGPDTPVIALIETALGVHRAYEIATVDRVVRLAFGAIDFALDIGAAEDDLALLYARSCIVVASRAAGISPPIDGVTVDLDDAAATRADAASARRLGFGGKLCIHPRQVEEVNAGFRPTENEVRQAQRIMAGVAEGGAARLAGQMIDKPVVDRARLVLLRAGLLGAPAPNPSRRS
jgi:citrate lyase subunit beta/citryl-CoA lyase